MVATFNIHSEGEEKQPFLPYSTFTRMHTCEHTHTLGVAEVLFMERVILLTPVRY